MTDRTAPTADPFRMHLWPAVTLGLCLWFAAPISTTMAQTPLGAGEYAACMDLINRNPTQAFERAGQWEGIGGGEPARHCAAAALVALGEAEAGAIRLEELADLTTLDPTLRVSLLAQAGRAWLQVPDRPRAVATLTTALSLSERLLAHGDAGAAAAFSRADLYVERAIILADGGDVPSALEDLNAALTLAPAMAEALVLRAAARRMLGNAPGALADTDQVVRQDPSHTQALLERGAAHQALGDFSSARADWRAVIAQDPSSHWADKARDHLARMDLGSSDLE